MNYQKYTPLLAVLGVFVVVATLTGWVVGRNAADSPQSSEPTQPSQQNGWLSGMSGQNQEKSAQNTVETQTFAQDPYYSMTIPYFRGRDYQSELAQLEQVSQASTYTSYLTSYDSDGLQVNGLLTIPEGEPSSQGWPAIVFIHGYIPPTLYQTQERYQAYVDYLARNGFVVFKIDLRGHGESEGTASGAYYSGDYVVDTLNAVAALRSSDFVDASSIGLWGHSMAGNVVMRSVAANQNISAAVIWAGAVYSYEDFVEYGLNDNSYRPPTQTSDRQRQRDQLFETHGRFSPESQFWQTVVPLNYLQGVATPIQFHHAANDSVVPISYSRDAVQRLESLGTSAEFFEYQTGGHDIEGGAFSTAMQRTVEFFQQHLANKNGV